MDNSRQDRPQRPQKEREDLDAEFEGEITEKQRRRLEYRRLGQLGPGCPN